MLGQRVWLSGVLLTAVAIGVAACGDNDETTELNAAAGSAGSGGRQPVAGQAGMEHAGASAEQGGEAGQSPCLDGLQVQKTVAGSIDQVVSWPAQHRVAIGVLKQGVLIYELAATGEVTLVETVGLKQLDLPASGAVYSIIRYGEGFVALTATDADAPTERRIINWQPSTNIELVPYPDPAPAWLSLDVADSEVGLAVTSPDGLLLATRAEDDWTWSGPFAAAGRRASALGLEAERILVGVQEGDRFTNGGASGEGGAAGGGQGGAGAEPAGTHARLEWWNLQGEPIESHVAVGNPTVAIKTEDGWLIGETNSFWGSYQAAIELLTDDGELRKLTDVPVISAGDGTDGAVDLALLGERLLVANCESGLRAGAWSTSQVTLAPLPGPWGDAALAECSPQQIEVVDDFAVMATGNSVVFARACD